MRAGGGFIGMAAASPPGSRSGNGMYCISALFLRDQIFPHVLQYMIAQLIATVKPPQERMAEKIETAIGVAVLLKSHGRHD